MNKQTFIQDLKNRLSGLPDKDMERSLDYYSEMIDDRMEDGLSEEEAIAAVGDPGEIAEQILSEIPIGKIVRQKLRSNHTMRAWEVLLLVLGSPLWVAVLAAVIVTVFAVYISVWSVVLSLFAVNLALAVSALACIASAAPLALNTDMAVGVFIFGAGLMIAGVSVLMFLICRRMPKAVLKLGKAVLRGFKYCFIRKAAAK